MKKVIMGDFSPRTISDNGMLADLICPVKTGESEEIPCYKDCAWFDIHTDKDRSCSTGISLVTCQGKPIDELITLTGDKNNGTNKTTNADDDSTVAEQTDK